MQENSKEVLPFPNSPKESSEKLTSKVDSSLNRYRRDWERNWQDYEDAYFGDIWKNTQQFRPYTNDIFRLLQSELPTLTDSLPSTAVNVMDPAYQEQASNLNEAVKWVQKDQQFDLMAPEVILNSLITGNGYIHQYYDANADNGDGKIIYEIVPWRQVWLSGEHSTIDRISKVKFQVKRTRDWLKLNYQEYAEEIEHAKPEKPSYDKDNGRDLETRDSGSMYGRRTRPKAYEDDDVLTLNIYYLKDFSTEPTPEEQTAQEMQEESAALQNGESPDVNKWQDHKSHLEGHIIALTEMYSQLQLPPEAGLEAAMQVIEQIASESPESGIEGIGQQIALLEAHIQEHQALHEENPKGHKPKYVNGWRCIEKVGKTVVFDDSNRYDHGEIPLTPFYCYRNGTIYADGEITNIIDPERMKAVMEYKTYKGLQKVANPTIIYDLETGIDEGELTNEDGQTIGIPQGTDIRHLQPGQVSEQVNNFVNDKRQSMQDISGVVEATQGKMPGPNAAAMTVHKTQQQAIGRIRLKDRQNQQYSIKRLGKQTACNVIQFWSGEKVLRMESKGADHSQIIFNPADMDMVKWELDISEGSQAGVDKDSYNMMLHNWKANGDITFAEMLELGEFPKRQQALDLVGEREDLATQMQQMEIENLKLKSKLDPELLSPEERKGLEDVQRQEQLTELSESQ